MKIFQTGILFFTAFFLLVSCQEEPAKVMTVNGWMDAEEMGVTLTHEHIMLDWTGADSLVFDSWNKDSIFFTVSPYLFELKQFDCNTFIEVTPSYMGRDPEIYRRLSNETGINIIFSVGYYGAMQNRFVPKHAYTETAEQLAQRWLDEWKNGCRETGIRPGLIKVGVAYKPELSELHQKFVRAACMTHLQSGLTIAIHSGPVARAREILEIFQQEGVAPEAFVWTHALKATHEEHIEIGNKGAWVSFDKVNEKNTEELVSAITNMREHHMLNKVLLSHDAGWYNVGQPGGGEFRPYTALFTNLLPALKKSGFTQEETDQMLIKNPIDAYAVRIRKAE